MWKALITIVENAKDDLGGLMATTKNCYGISSRKF